MSEKKEDVGGGPEDKKEKLSQIVEKLNKELLKEMAHRPYLFVVASGYEISRKEGVSTLAPQWSWRSNVIVGAPESQRVAEFLADQLKDVAENPENGVKALYKKNRPPL